MQQNRCIERVKIPAGVLLDSMKSVVQTTQNEKSMDARYRGACMLIEPDSFGMWSTDCSRLTLYRVKTSVKGAEGGQMAIIPLDSMKEVIRALRSLTAAELREQSVTFMKRGDHLIFDFDGERLEVDGNFSERDWDLLDRIIPKRFSAEFEVERKEFEFKLKLASLGAYAVTFSIEPGQMKLAGQFSAMEDFLRSEAYCHIDYDGEPMEMAFNAKGVRDFFKARGSKRLRMKLPEKHGACVMEDPDAPEGVEFAYVMMPQPEGRN